MAAVRPAPAVSRFLEFPVTGAISAMAIFVTIAIKSGRTDIDPFVMSSVAFDSEPWRLASSALPHGNWFHLIFNIIWLWVLGTKLEEVWGHVPTLAIFAVLAVGSGAAEWAFAVGGIGLSGVGYGLVGLLWILRKRDPRFRDAIDRNVVITFLAWGVLCVLLTVSNVWAIGNIAHGSGLVIGGVLGYAIAPGPSARRIAAAAGAVILVGGLVFVAGWMRPDVNFSANAGDRDGYLGAKALENKEYELAARHLRRALELDSDADDWYNYGIALGHVADPQGLTPVDAWNRALLNSRGEHALAKRAIASQYWNRGVELERAGKPTEAQEEFSRARKIDPDIGK